MSDAVLGALLLHLLGLAFLTAAGSAWSRRRATGRGPGPGVLVDAVIGALAVGDAAVTVADESARVAHWSAGALLVLLVAGLPLVRHRRAAGRPRIVMPPPAAPAEGVPAPRQAETYMPLTSSPT